MFVHVDVWVHIYVYACGGQTLTSGVFSACPGVWDCSFNFEMFSLHHQVARWAGVNSHHC